MSRVWNLWANGEVFGGRSWSPQHRHFLKLQLLIAVIALSVFPLWLFVEGAISTQMTIVLVWLLGPLLSAALLVKTRSLSLAFACWSLSFVGLICTLSIMTGGVQSFAVIWLLAVPFEAALSKRRSLVLFSIGLIVIAAAFLIGATDLNMLAVGTPLLASDPFGFFMGPVAVIVYATISATRILSVQQDNDVALAANEHRYRLMADNGTDLITRHDLSGEIVFASPSAENLLGVPAKQIEGSGFFERIHVADRPAYMQLLMDLRLRQSSLTGEFRVKRNRLLELAPNASLSDAMTDHDHCWIEMRCRPVWDGDEKMIGSVATIRDVSERRAQEEALKEAHENLQGLSEAKSRFLANMSHELRTALNAIIGFSELLGHELADTPDHQKHRDYAKHIHEAGSHLLQVVTDVLDIRRLRVEHSISLPNLLISLTWFKVVPTS